MRMGQGTPDDVMTFLIIALLVAGVFFLAKQKVKPSNRVSAAGRGIQMTEEETELERQSVDETMRMLDGFMSASGYFKEEKIPELIATLNSGTAPYDRLNLETVFKGDSYLSVEEKRSLGLNTRMKYSQSFLDYWDPASFQIIEPKGALLCMYHDAFHRVSRKRALESYRKLGFVRTVRIHPDDCATIKRAKKLYSIDGVPDLPLPGCDAEFCRCWFEAIIPRDN